jgi:hypothetical protein
MSNLLSKVRTAFGEGAWVFHSAHQYEQVSVMVTLRACIKDVPGSNTGRYNRHHEQGFIQADSRNLSKKIQEHIAEHCFILGTSVART